MTRRFTPADFNLTPLADPLLGSRLTTSLLLALVVVFVATGEEAGLILAGVLFCVVWPAFMFVWSRHAHYEIELTDSANAASASALPFALPDPARLMRALQSLVVPTTRRGFAGESSSA